jgi:hypothetical protein
VKPPSSFQFPADLLYAEVLRPFLKKEAHSVRYCWVFVFQAGSPWSRSAKPVVKIWSGSNSAKLKFEGQVGQGAPDKLIAKAVSLRPAQISPLLLTT